MIALLLEIVGKVTVLFALALLLTVASRRRASAAFRHRVYGAALGGSLILPILCPLLRSYQATIPVRVAALVHPETPSQIAAGQTDDEAVATNPAPAAEPTKPSVGGAMTTASPIAIMTPAVPIAPAVSPRGSWVTGLLALYAGGVFAVLVHAAGGLFGLRRLTALTLPVDASEALLSSAVPLAREKMGVRAVVRPRIALSNSEAEAAIATPMTWGILRPVLALPSDAREWPEARLRAALLHEMAHIRRGDFLTQAILARFAMALYWFHPLVWIVVRQLRVESERACDDLALTAGHLSGPDYARHLLDVAARVMPHPVGRGGTIAVAMAASGSPIEQRLRGILDPRRNRREGGRVVRSVTAAMAVTVIAGATLLRFAAVAASVKIESDDMSGPQTIALLPNGATVQLLGIYDPHRNGAAWWDGRGKRLTVAPIKPVYVAPVREEQTLRWLGFAYTVTAPRSAQPTNTWVGAPNFPADRWVSAGGNRYAAEPQTGLSCEPSLTQAGTSYLDQSFHDDASGRWRTHTTLQSMTFQPTQSKSDVKIDVAAGPWTDVIRFPNHWGQTTVKTRFGEAHLTLTPHEGAAHDKVSVGIYDRFLGQTDNFDRFAIAVDKQGRVVRELSYAGTVFPVSGTDATLKHQTMDFLPSNLLPQIAEFRVLLRPYQTITFRHVPLQPVATATPEAFVDEEVPTMHVTAPDGSVTATTDWSGATKISAMLPVAPGNEVTLLNGARVRLMDILDRTPHGDRWWDLSGTRVTAGPFPRDTAFPPTPVGSKRRAIALSVTYDEKAQPQITGDGSGPPDFAEIPNPSPSALSSTYYVAPSIEWYVVPSVRKYPEWANLDQRRRPTLTGESFDSFLSSYAFPAAQTTATVQARVAAGPWTTVVRCPKKVGESVVSTPVGVVRFNLDRDPATSKDEYTTLQVSDPLRGGEKSFERRIVAVDSAGRLVGSATQFGPDWNIERKGYESGANLETRLFPRIAEFRLYVRPVQWVEFDHIPLDPKTATANVALTPAR